MTTPPTAGPAGRAWTCDGCGRSSLWTDDHQWYGSLKDIDEELWGKIVVTCSDACRRRCAETGKVSADAELLAS